MPSDLHELIQRIRDGDDEAAVEFVAVYGPHIRREARRRMLDERLQRFFDQSDIVQSVMANVVMKLRVGSLAADSAPQLLSLLMSMTRSKVADRYREHAAGKRDYRRNEAIADRAPQDGCTPSEVVSFREELARLEAEIPLELRPMVEMRRNGADWEEIASRFQLTPDACRKRYSRLVQRLEAAIEKEENDR